jgi:hypothetical protein
MEKGTADSMSIMVMLDGINPAADEHPILLGNKVEEGLAKHLCHGEEAVVETVVD